MELVADESIDRQIVVKLREDGHQIWYVAEMEPGIPDSTVLAVANEKSAVLVTADKDFGELVYRQRRFNSGIVLIRLAGLPAERKAEIVSAVIRQHGPELSRAFSVISHTDLRIRRAYGRE